MCFAQKCSHSQPLRPIVKNGIFFTVVISFVLRTRECSSDSHTERVDKDGKTTAGRAYEMIKG